MRSFFKFEDYHAYTSSLEKVLCSSWWHNIDEVAVNYTSMTSLWQAYNSDIEFMIIGRTRMFRIIDECVDVLVIERMPCRMKLLDWVHEAEF